MLQLYHVNGIIQSSFCNSVEFKRRQRKQFCNVIENGFCSVLLYHLYFIKYLLLFIGLFSNTVIIIISISIYLYNIIDTQLCNIIEYGLVFNLTI